MSDVLAWIPPAVLCLTAFVPSLWVAGAIYYDACGRSPWGRLLATLWLLGVVALLLLAEPLWQACLALLALDLLFLAWWVRLKPSHDRDWDPAVAVLPRATREGDRVVLKNVRDFEYRTRTDFTPRYETRVVHLANLAGLDVAFFHWGSPWMCHPIVVFDFGPDGRVAVSIEVRYRKGQRYNLLTSLFRQQELIFLVVDERDAILRRTKYGQPEDGHLYRFQLAPERVRLIFLDYVKAINSLSKTPRWYHGLLANCTTSFYRLPHSRCRLDWRVIANGRLDEVFYEDGLLDRSLPFAELRRLSHINEIANRAPRRGFGDYLRGELEKRRQARPAP